MKIPNRYLLILDFDGTAARTYEKSPNSIGVNEAYVKTIEGMFGYKGLEIYQAIGGLKSRAPRELTHLLLSYDTTGELLDNGRCFYETENKRLAELSSTANDKLQWDDNDPEKVLTELLVRQKIAYLANEIGAKLPDGTAWPKPCRCFLDFWNTVQHINEAGSVKLDTAIASSGHTTIIRRIFENVWNVKPPDIFVTDDEIRYRRFPEELVRRIKPGPLMVALIHKQWLNNQGLWVEGGDNVDIARKSRNQMVYFGDDPIKDGQMAMVSSIPFGLFKERQSFCDYGKRQFSFGDWQVVSRALLDNYHLLREGKPVEEIFLNKYGMTENFYRPFFDRPPVQAERI